MTNFESNCEKWWWFLSISNVIIIIIQEVFICIILWKIIIPWILFKFCQIHFDKFLINSDLLSLLAISSYLLSTIMFALSFDMHVLSAYVDPINYVKFASLRTNGWSIQEIRPGAEFVQSYMIIPWVLLVFNRTLLWLNILMVDVNKLKKFLRKRVKYQ